MSSPGQPPTASPAAVAPAKPVQRRTSLDVLMRDGSVAAAAAGQAGLGLGLGLGLGSQDLTGLLLDPSLLQHMQSLPRVGTGIELDLLASPKWKALLSWEGDGGGTGGSMPSMDTAGSRDSAAPSNTAFHLAGLEGEGPPVSPGVDQKMSAAALEAAWREAQQAQRGQHSGAQEPPVLVPQEVLVKAQLQTAVRPRGFGGKKRPGPEPECDAEADAAGQAGAAVDARTAMPPPLKQRRTEPHSGSGQGAAQPAGLPACTAPELGLGQGHSLTTFSSGDTLMLEAEAAAAFDSEACPREDLSPTDVLTGLNRVRLNSIGSPRTHRRLTAAAAAAAITPAGRRGRLRRGESNVPMLDAAVPGSPTGAQLLQEAGEEQGTAGAASLPAAQPKPEPLTAPTGPSAGATPADLAAAAAAAAAVVAACAPMFTPAAGAAAPPAPAAAAGASQVERRVTSSGRQQLPTKSHKAVATGEGGVFTSAYRGVTRHRLTGRYEAHYWDSSYVRPNVKKGGRTKGRQVYLGGYETELEAARAYDRAVLAYVGASAPLNFPLEDYDDDLVWMAGRTAEEVVGILRRGSVGFARGQSQYRGVTRHHQANRWEARIGKVVGDKYLYLGSFNSPEEAARAYDRACVKYRGAKAILNFDLSHYQDILDDPDSYNPAAAVADAPAPSPQTAAYSGGWAAGGAGGLSGGMWGGAATAGQQAAGSLVSPSQPCPAGYFGSPGGMMDGASAMGAPGLMFLPMLQPQGWPAGAPQQFGLHAFAQQAHMQPPLHSPAKQEPVYAAPSAFQPPTAPASQHPVTQPAAGLRPIRTRATAATAAGQGGSAGGGGAGGSMPPPPPVPPAGGTGLDLAELLSPLAASLLSPLGLNGSPAGWKDSPLSRLSTGQLARLLSNTLEGSGGSGLLSGLLSPTSTGSGRGGAAAGTAPGRHRLATEGTAGTPGSGNNSARGLSSEALSRLFSSPTSEADLFSALQWLDSLPADQLAQLAAMEAAPNGPAAVGASSGGGDATHTAPPAGTKGAVRRNNSSNGSNRA